MGGLLIRAIGSTQGWPGSRWTVAVAFSVVAMMFATIAPATLAAGGAERVSLIHNGSFSCEGGALEGYGLPGDGFAVINVASPGHLMAQVRLRAGLPAATYSVRLIQSAGLGGSIADCFVEDGTLSTDGSGDGHANLHEVRLPDTIGAYVILVHLPDATGPLDIHGTRLVLVS